MKQALALLSLLLAACGSSSGTFSCLASRPADVAGAGVACGGSGHLAERISTDLPNYTRGAPITITVTATNDSSVGCGAPTACPPLAAVIVNAQGVQIWSTPNVRAACPALAILLSPGQSVSYPVTATGLDLPAGVYSTTGPPAQVAAYGRSYFTVC